MRSRWGSRLEMPVTLSELIRQVGKGGLSAMYGLTDYGWMLRDPSRIDGYRRALGAVITPQSVVVDLGAGIGTFSVISCMLGAARVYAIEQEDVISVAEAIAARNGVAGRIRFVRSRISKVELPEKADVIVSDLSGALPLFHHHIPSVIHAREHFLAKGGTLIPARARLLCAPISSTDLYARVTGMWHGVSDIDFSVAESMALNTPLALPVEPRHLCAEPQCWGELDYTTISSPDVESALQWTVGDDLMVHGFALWFETTLLADIVLTSGPWSPANVHATLVLPLLKPLSLQSGEALGLTIDARLIGDSYVVSWQAGTGTKMGEQQSNFFSKPLTLDSPAAREQSAVAAAVPEGGRWRRTPAVLARDAGNGMLLLDLNGRSYHRLNETAAEIWRMLDTADTVPEIEARLVTLYDLAHAEAADAVQEMLGRFRELGLIAWLEADGEPI
jgi:hypothetical protein